MSALLCRVCARELGATRFVKALPVAAPADGEELARAMAERTRLREALFDAANMFVHLGAYESARRMMKALKP